MEVPKDLAPDKKELAELLESSKRLYIRNNRKMILLTAKHDDSCFGYHHTRGLSEGGIGKTYLMLGVYQLEDLSEMHEEQEELIIQRTKNVDSGPNWDSQLEDSMLLYSKTVCDHRSVGEIVDEIVGKFDGVKGVVFDDGYSRKSQGTYAEAFFKLESLSRIMNEYF